MPQEHEDTASRAHCSIAKRARGRGINIFINSSPRRARIQESFPLELRTKARAQRQLYLDHTLLF